MKRLNQLTNGTRFTFTDAEDIKDWGTEVHVVKDEYDGHSVHIQSTVVWGGFNPINGIFWNPIVNVVK